MSGELFAPIFASDALMAATSDRAVVEALVRFEVELAAAQAEVGLLPREAAGAIAAAAGSLQPEPAELGRLARSSGNPVVPLVRALSDAAGSAGGYVHFGATSQDALDTAIMLVSKEASARVCAALAEAARAAFALAERYPETLLAGRTLLQQALPVPFALKACGWAVGCTEAAESLARVRRERLAVQLGGAAGTLASLGTAGPEVVRVLARRLGLAEPALAWHSERGRIAELGASLAGAAGAAGKVALDLVLLAQSEVAEVQEAPGRGVGGSSTLPHKQNPIGSVRARAAALRAPQLAATLLAAMQQEHERAAGSWHVEWESLLALLRAAGGAAEGVAGALGALVVDEEAMAANLARTRGVLLAERVMLDLAPDLGRSAAHELVEEAVRHALSSGTSLRQALGASAEISAARDAPELDRLCDPAGYLGASAAFVARARARGRADADGER
jgi:3-carboxy-cis,cis-muconate cycloisomerase